MRALVVIAALAACYAPPDYRKTHFACKQSSVCPEGMLCSEDHCVPPSDDELLIDQAFVIQRDAVTAAEYAACVTAERCPVAWSSAAYCAYLDMRLPSAMELRAAEAAGVVDDGVRCVRSVP